MATEKQAVKLKHVIQADPEQVFAMLTEAGRLREWLCDEARSEPRAGGRFVFRWNSGYEAQGSFVSLEAPEEAILVWQGQGEPGPTLVEWEIEQEDEGVEVSLKHVGFGGGSRWRSAWDEAERGWSEALENLQSVLEKGIDLREARRPFLGIYLEEMNARRAEEEGIATESGIYIQNVVEGQAAESAGVQSGDVLVRLGDHEIAGLGDLVAAMRAFRAGAEVELGLVRKQERLSLPATLGTRDLPEVPATAQEAAAQLRERYAQVDAGLQEATAGLSEEQANQAPAEGEWSVRQVLAHLTDTERWIHRRIFEVAMGQWQEGGYNAELAQGLQAVVLEVEPTLAGLLGRLRQDMAETVTRLEHLPDAVQAERYRYRQIVSFIVQLAAHLEDHLGQIRQAAAAARGEEL